MRTFTAAMITCALLLAARERAMAIAEYCPAEIDLSHGVGTSSDSAPAQMWAYTLRAENARTVSGTIVAQTDAGWFAFPFRNAVLVGGNVDYRTIYASFSRREYESAPLYVRFPGPVKILRWWIANATTTADAAFGWNAGAQYACLPQAGLGVSTGRSGSTFPLRRLTPEPNLSIPPPPGTPVVQAGTIAEPLGMTTCATPFTNAHARMVGEVGYPLGYRLHEEVTVEVAIAGDGHLDDAWVYAPSGYEAFDKEAMRTVKSSEFVGGTALCQPAPGLYIFIVTFNDPIDFEPLW